jgi:hypothetical protein
VKERTSLIVEKKELAETIIITAGILSIWLILQYISPDDFDFVDRIILLLNLTLVMGFLYVGFMFLSYLRKKLDRYSKNENKNSK